MTRRARQILALPHAVDRKILDEDYARLPAFLRGADNARPRERGHGNGQFFQIVAAEWMELASLRYVFGHRPAEIADAAKRGLKDFVDALKLGHSAEPSMVLEYFCAAAAIGDRGSANAIVGTPDETLGFLDDEDNPWPLFVTAAFTFSAKADREVRLNLKLLREIFDAPLEKAYRPARKEMVNLHRLMTAIVKADAGAFDEHLLERCRMRARVLDGDPADDKPSLIDWTALGLVRFARDRRLPVTAQHVYVPVQILAGRGR